MGVRAAEVPGAVIQCVEGAGVVAVRGRWPENLSIVERMVNLYTACIAMIVRVAVDIRSDGPS